jgi:repressor LexA
MTELGQPTLDILQAIIQYKTAHDGLSPTMRKLAVITGTASTSTIDYHLNRLEEAGMIQRDPFSSRAIRVTGGEWRYSPETVVAE